MPISIFSSKSKQTKKLNEKYVNSSKNVNPVKKTKKKWNWPWGKKKSIKVESIKKSVETIPQSVESSNQPSIKKSKQSSIKKSKQNENIPKIIKHFWYRKWPDLGAPNLDDDNERDSFIEFIIDLLIDINNNKGGTVIHCSAGVGRTGTLFVILKICLQLLKSKKIDSIESFKILFKYKQKKITSNSEPIYENLKKVQIDDINKAITYIRIRRMLSVQTVEQYYFILRLFDLFKDEVYANKKYNELLKITSEKNSNNDNYILKKENVKEDTKIDLTQENIKIIDDYSILESQIEDCKKKNRYRNIIPFDQNRVIIDPDNKNCVNYINASYLNTKIGNTEVDDQNFNGIVIASDCPSKDAQQNFLKMLNLKKENIVRIIMLTGLEEKGKLKCDDYTSKNDPISYTLTDINNDMIGKPYEEPLYGNIQEMRQEMNNEPLYGNIQEMNNEPLYGNIQEMNNEPLYGNIFTSVKPKKKKKQNIQNPPTYGNVTNFDLLNDGTQLKLTNGIKLYYPEITMSQEEIKKNNNKLISKYTTLFGVTQNNSKTSPTSSTSSLEHYRSYT